MTVKVEKLGVRFVRLDPEYWVHSPKHRRNLKLGSEVKVVTVRMPVALYDKLLLYAVNNRLSVSDVVRRAVDEYISKGG